MSTAPTGLGAPYRPGLPPGVYELRTDGAASAELRLDLPAFVGLTERGPICAPVALDSWGAYLRTFGQPGGGRQTPQAVHHFFANGGRRCVVVRAVDTGAAMTARWRLPGARLTDASGAVRRYVQIWARDPGAWGDRLRVGSWWDVEPLPERVLWDSGALAWTVRSGWEPKPGSLLRAVWKNSNGARGEGQAFVVAQTRLGAKTKLTLSEVLPPDALICEALNLSLEVSVDSVVERYLGAGLHPEHPSYLMDQLRQRSALVCPSDPLKGCDRLVPQRVGGEPLSLRNSRFAQAKDLLRPGKDGEQATSRAVFFNPPSAPPDDLDAPLYEGLPAPLAALDTWDEHAETEPVALVNLPDLAHAPRGAVVSGLFETLSAPETVFAPECRPTHMSTRPAPVRWPLLAADYQPEALQDLAVELLAWAGGARRVLVLDLPPGLDADAVRRWHLALQASPASDRAAVYGPWVWAAPVEDPQASARLVPPGGAVCGIIAASERRGGAWSIPANTLVQSAFAPDSDPRLPDPGFLHEERVNTLRSTERGLVLLGARTSSADPEWAFLNVRRAVDWLALQLPLDARWAVFEPNDARLWRRLELCVERRLRQLWQANALAGSSAADSYFVRCDASVHSQADLDAGRVVALVGLAVAAPVEFIVFRLSLSRDGSSSLEVSGG